ncbi:hypothetical protein G5B40_01555 [Pikeienuella piscinae]|uniref:Uncharacterized protein n=1 Tax=Pikeienuella piscinae TaxID=2748098 RepID=A0A7L5BTD4_9RHOB|nr:hypothetical protein [Pikeienuella piscinae]QIE54241.1 hypothetical protein G5B40_01555 [Pikeienuella piscinae]
MGDNPYQLRLMMRESAERTAGVEAVDFMPARGALARLMRALKDLTAGAPAASEVNR